MTHTKPSTPDAHLAEFFLGLLVGGVIGTSLSVLLTPQSGRQTIELAGNMPSRLRADWNNPYGKTRGMVNQGQAQLQNRLETVRHQQQARRIAKAKKRETSASEQDNSFST